MSPEPEGSFFERSPDPVARFAFEDGDAVIREVNPAFEATFDRAVERAGPGVSVTVGRLPEGFYVADDGPGIDPADSEAVFDVGYTTHREGTGFGLGIVRRVADAHGWSVRATESGAGGARFEVTGVEFLDG